MSMLEDLIACGKAPGPFSLAQALRFNDDWDQDAMCESCGSKTFDFTPGDPGILTGPWEGSYPPTDDECYCENCGTSANEHSLNAVRDALIEGRESI